MSDEKTNPASEQEKPKIRRQYKTKGSSQTAAKKQESPKTSKQRGRKPVKKESTVESRLDLSGESLDLLAALKKDISKTRGSLDKTAVDALRKNIEQFFKKHKIAEFGKSGDKFDPKIHYALLFMKEEGVEENRILEVKSQGIKAGRTLIRKSKVIVSK